MHPDYRRNRILSHGPQSLPDSGARCPVPYASLVLMRGSVLHHSPCVVYRHAFQPDSLCIPKKSFLLFLGVTYPFVEQAECRCHRHRLVFLHHRHIVTDKGIEYVEPIDRRCSRLLLPILLFPFVIQRKQERKSLREPPLDKNNSGI